MTRYLLTLFLVTACCVSWRTAYGQQNPVTPQARVFREVLTGEDYERRFREALGELPSVAELESSKMPLTGTVVVATNSGYQVERLGLEVGDVLLSIDDVALWAVWVDWQRTEDFQTLRVIKPNGEERDVELQPGLIGVQYEWYRRPDLAYIRRPDRNKALDELVLVGLMKRESDPDLAETAWHHAIRQGYQQDDLSDACLAVIAREQGRFGEAVRVAEEVPAIDPEHPYRLSPEQIIKIASPLGRFDMIQALGRDVLTYQGMDPERVDELTEVIENLGGPMPSPVAAAADMKRTDLMASAMVVNDRALRSGRDDYGLLAEGSAVMSRPQGHYTNFLIGFRKPSRDVDMVIRFTMTAQPKQTRWANVFEVFLMDRDYRMRHGIDMRTMEAIELRSKSATLGFAAACNDRGETEYQLNFANIAEGQWFYKSGIDLTRPTEFEVRMTRVGGFAEIRVNGETLLLTPVIEPTERHGVFLMVVGANVQIHSLEAAGLE